VRLSVDSTVGCGNVVIPSPDDLADLHSKGLFSLNQVEDNDTNTVWSQGWKSAQYLELEGEREARWNVLVEKLRKSHIGIKESDKN